MVMRWSAHSVPYRRTHRSESGEVAGPGPEGEGRHRMERPPNMETVVDATNAEGRTLSNKGRTGPGKTIRRLRPATEDEIGDLLGELYRAMTVAVMKG